METINITLPKSTLESLEEFRALFFENNELLGYSPKTFNSEVESIVNFAIHVALRTEKETNTRLKEQL